MDGPLIHAMRAGHMFLADEISLADDSVLERLNSVLEPERKLFLAEKGSGEENEIRAGKTFRLIGECFLFNKTEIFTFGNFNRYIFLVLF